MSTNENDPRPGRAEGRESSADNRTTSSVVELHFDDQCAPCTTLAQQMATVVKVDAPVDIRLGIECTHHAPTECPRCAEDYRRYLDENPVARALAGWANGTVLYVAECAHTTEEVSR